jgi:hypothetical protein
MPGKIINGDKVASAEFPGIIGCHSHEEKYDSASKKHYRGVCIILLDEILMTHMMKMTRGTITVHVFHRHWKVFSFER